MSALSACMPLWWKRVLDATADDSEPPCGCWELNPGPLEEQPVLLTAEPSLQPLPLYFTKRKDCALQPSQGMGKTTKLVT